MKILSFKYEDNRFELYAMFMDDILSLDDRVIQYDMLMKSKAILKIAIGTIDCLKIEDLKLFEETNSVYCSYTFGKGNKKTSLQQK
ncbi:MULTISPECIES: hypothetical protein [Bacillus]|uniref:hypothetical protein n=1 Tax=Bacillus TaxID=1386 RepID=UPI002ABE5584|nr:hypothetical protein [Bacillus pumilus]